MLSFAIWALFLSILITNWIKNIVDAILGGRLLSPPLGSATVNEITPFLKRLTPALSYQSYLIIIKFILSSSLGKMSLVGLLKILEGIIARTTRQPIRNGLKTTTFLRLQRMEFTPEFYTIPSVSSPWLLKTRISYLGNTSYLRDTDLSCQKSGVFLARNVMTIVAVDTKTRRPTRIPEGFAKFVNAAAKNTTPTRFYFPEYLLDQKPLFSSSVFAAPSDTDDNQHLNHTVSIRYCLDCASVAATRGDVFKQFSKDMSYYNVKSFTIEYRAEMREGDMVNVQCWEDPENQCVLYFVIKVGEQTACRCVGEWYADDKGQPVHELNNELRFLEGAVSKL